MNQLAQVPGWAWVVGYGTEFALVVFGLNHLFRTVIPRIARRAARREMENHEAIYHSGIEELTR